MISKLPEPDGKETYLDFRGVRSLDVRQRTVVELLLESLGEEHSELGVVDELRQSAWLSFIRVPNRLTGIPKSTAARRDA